VPFGASFSGMPFVIPGARGIKGGRMKPPWRQITLLCGVLLVLLGPPFAVGHAMVPLESATRSLSKNSLPLRADSQGGVLEKGNIQRELNIEVRALMDLQRQLKEDRSRLKQAREQLEMSGDVKKYSAAIEKHRLSMARCRKAIQRKTQHIEQLKRTLANVDSEVTSAP
jgi:hypothetical protein